MTKSQLFTKAHALTRQTVQAGDSYHATFALCLKAVYAEQKQDPMEEKLQKILAIVGDREHEIERVPNWRILVYVAPDFMGSYAEISIKPDGSHEVAFGRGRIADAISAC